MEFSSTLFIIALLNALMYFSAAALVIYAALKVRKAVSRHSLLLMSLLGVFATIRIFVPLDLETEYIIRSEDLLPALQLGLRKEVEFFGLSVGDLVLLVWFLGAVCFAVYYLLAMYRAKNVEKGFIAADKSLAEEAAGRLGCKYELKVSPSVPTPYTSGIRRPVIYLPSIELTEDELEMALRHELQHIRSGDNLKKLIFLVIQIVFWWNPLCYLLRKEFDQIIELQCDAKATENCTDAERVRYARLLYSVMEKLGGREHKTVLTSHLGSSGSRILQRFRSLLTPNAVPGLKSRLLIYFVVFALFLASYFVKIQPFTAPPAMDIMHSVVETEGNDILEIDGVFYVVNDGQVLAPVPQGDYEYIN